MHGSLPKATTSLPMATATLVQTRDSLHKATMREGVVGQAVPAKGQECEATRKETS